MSMPRLYPVGAPSLLRLYLYAGIAPRYSQVSTLSVRRPYRAFTSALPRKAAIARIPMPLSRHYSAATSPLGYYFRHLF